MTSTFVIEEIPQTEWRYAWRLDQYDSALSKLDRERIHPLAAASSKQLSNHLNASGIHDDFPFKKGLFRRTEMLALTPVNNQGQLLAEDQLVKKWLYQRGIPFATPVFLSYDNSNAVLTTWKMLIRHWRLFYYSIADDLTVWDESMNWCLLFFHEHELHFGTNRKNPILNAHPL